MLRGAGPGRGAEPLRCGRRRCGRVRRHLAGRARARRPGPGRRVPHRARRVHARGRRRQAGHADVAGVLAGPAARARRPAGPGALPPARDSRRWPSPVSSPGSRPRARGRAGLPPGDGRPAARPRGVPAAGRAHRRAARRRPRLPRAAPTVVLDRLFRPGLQLAGARRARRLLAAGGPAVFAAAWAAPYLPVVLLAGYTLGRRARDGHQRQRRARCSRPAPTGRSPRRARSPASPSSRCSASTCCCSPRWAACTPAGLYAVAGKYVVLSQVAGGGLSQAVQPRLAERLAVEDVDGVRALYQQATAWLILATWPLHLIVAVQRDRLPGTVRTVLLRTVRPSCGSSPARCWWPPAAAWSTWSCRWAAAPAGTSTTCSPRCPPWSPWTSC